MRNKFLALITIIVVLFTGCAEDNTIEPSTENEVLTIWAFDQYALAAQEAADIYSLNNPDVEFEIVELSQDALVEKLRISLANGATEDLPDILIEEDYNIKGYLTYYQDFFADLTGEFNFENYMDFKIYNATYEDKLYALPYDSGTAAMFYRLDYIEEAGYTEQDMQDLTWDEFITIGEAVYSKTGVYMIPIVPEGNIEGRAMIQSAGKWYYDLEGNLDILENDAIYDMMITQKELFESGIVLNITSWDDLIASAYNGNVATVIGGSWWANILAANTEQSGLWRLTKIPEMTNDNHYTSYSNVGGCGWLVLDNNNTSISIDFLKETFDQDVELINTLVSKTQLVTVRKDALDVPSALSGDPFFGNQNICEIMSKWGEHILPVNYGENSYEIAYKHGELMLDYLNGSTSIDQTLLLLHEAAMEIENDE